MYDKKTSLPSQSSHPNAEYLSIWNTQTHPKVAAYSSWYYIVHRRHHYRCHHHKLALWKREVLVFLVFPVSLFLNEILAQWETGSAKE